MTLKGLFEPVGEPGTVDEYAWLQTVDYQLCTSFEALDAYVAEAEAGKLPIACDWETTSLNHYNGSLLEVGMSISARHATGLYVPLAHLTDAHLNLSRARLLATLQRLDAAECPLVFYNYKYDGEVFLGRMQWEPKRWQDAMLAVWLEDSNQKTIGLKPTTRRLLGFKLLQFDTVTDGRPFNRLSPHDAVNYACGDADATRRIWMLPKIQAAIAEQEGIYKTERSLIPVVRRGVRQGVYLDKRKLEAMRAEIGNELIEHRGKKTERVVIEMSGQLKEMRDLMYQLAGGPFDLASPKQIGERLTALGVPIEERTKTGQVETGKEVLAKYAAEYPVCAAITKFRELETQDRNYLAKMVAAVDHFGPHVRFPFNTMGAPTGRMSAGGEGGKGESFDKGVVNVNVQSMPDPEKREKKPYLPDIRGAICANDPTTNDREFVFVAIDYSQLQMRIAGNYAMEPAWIRAFANGEDIHLTNAKLAYGRSDLTSADKSHRKAGKTMGFAILFGAAAGTVAEHGGISVKVAKELLDTFFSNAYNLRQFIERTHARAKVEKRVKTKLGRVRRLEEFYAPGAPQGVKLKGDREAVNSLIQGAEADVFKLACVHVHRLIDRNGWHDDWQQVLWVHDELVSRVRRTRVAELLPLVQAAMELQIKGWPIKLTTDAAIGDDTWGDLVSADTWLKANSPVVDGKRTQVQVYTDDGTRLRHDGAVPPGAVQATRAAVSAPPEPGHSDGPGLPGGGAADGRGPGAIDGAGR